MAGSIITPDNPNPAPAPVVVNAPDVTQAITDSSKGDMGLGSLKVLGNATAMVVVAFAFLYGGKYFLDQQTALQAEAIRQSDDNRKMFRDELKEMRTDAMDRFNRTEATHGKAMEKMGGTIERACTSMEKATRALEKTAAKIPEPDGGGP